MNGERWAACLPCRQTGKSSGEWFDHPDRISSDDVCLTTEHRATVDVFEHHDLTRILHHGEGSPAEMVLAAAAMAALDLDSADPDAYVQWTVHTGRQFGPASAAGFAYAYRGTFPDRAAYTRHYCETVGEINPDACWPHTCIDWRSAADELFPARRYALPGANGWLHIFATDR